MDMEWWLNESWVRGYRRRVRVACDIHAREKAVRIDEYIKLDRARPISQVKRHGEHTPAAMSFRGEQRLQASFPRHFQVIATTATVAKSRDCSRRKLLQKPLAAYNFAPLCKELSPMPSHCGVIHLYTLF
jgi:hypothetical protein